jgi:hypothetical protein
MSFLKSCIAVLVVAFTVVAPPFAHANLVTNGDFSAGDAGWTTNWNINADTASTQCVGSGCITGGITSGSYLYQDISTTPGTAYTLSFDFEAFGGNPMELQVLFGNTVAADFLNAGSIAPTTFTFSNLVANSGTTRLLFLGRNDPGVNLLNNVDVEGSAVPEPGTLALVGTAVLGLAGMARRRFC